MIIFTIYWEASFDDISLFKLIRKQLTVQPEHMHGYRSVRVTCLQKYIEHYNNETVF